MKHCTVACAIACAVSSVVAQHVTVGATVKAQVGTFIGHAAKNRTNVSEYLGIRYAQSPVGSARFEAPRPYSYDTIYNASSYSVDCPQIGLKAPPIKYPGQTPQFDSIINDFAGGRGNKQGDDCLSLNIWTKNPGTTQKKGVLVWLHGGRFTIGDTNTPFYTGQYIVDSQDIVFVSLNYRLNIFGFSGSPSAPANVGLLDQRRAIEWVRDNIAAFGGDPTLITIMGQSAGGSAVDFYSYAYASDPIIAGMISHSGTSHSFTPNTPSYSASSFSAAASSIGCTGSDAAVLICMQNKPVAEVLNSTTHAPPLHSAALPQPVFHPTVDNITVFANYTALAATHSFSKTPYLLGNTDKEDGFYHIAAAGAHITLTPQQWTLFDLEGFTCATLLAASARAAAHVPVWRYRYFGTFPNLALYPDSGAYHGSDLHMVFGAAADVTGLSNTKLEDWTSAYMMQAWGAFVRDPRGGLRYGDAGGGACGRGKRGGMGSGQADGEGLSWPTFEPDRDTALVRLAYNGSARASFGDPREFDALCPRNGSVAEAQGAF